MTTHRKIGTDQNWDGWAPTEEMISRAEANRPFWSYWEKDRVTSVQELHDAFTMRCAASLVRSFDPSRSPHKAAPHMTQAEEDVYGRLVEWLLEVHNAGLKRYIAMVQGVILREENCPDQHLFSRMIEFHVKLRMRDMQRYVAQRHRK